MRKQVSKGRLKGIWNDIFSSLKHTSIVSLAWKHRRDENDQASIEDLKFH